MHIHCSHEYCYQLYTCMHVMYLNGVHIQVLVLPARLTHCIILLHSFLASEKDDLKYKSQQLLQPVLLQTQQLASAIFHITAQLQIIPILPSISLQICHYNSFYIHYDTAILLASSMYSYTIGPNCSNLKVDIKLVCMHE